MMLARLPLSSSTLMSDAPSSDALSCDAVTPL